MPRSVGQPAFGPHTSWASPLCQLRDTELLLLWSMRRWAVARTRGEPITEVLAQPFLLARLPDAPTWVDEFLVKIAVAARNPLVFRHLHCHAVGRDENLLLGVLRLLQRRRRGVALRNLGEIVRRGGARSICEVGEQLVDRLARAGLVLERRAALTLVARGGT